MVSDYDEQLRRLAEAVVEMNIAQTPRLVEEALAAGIPPTEIVSAGLSLGMRKVGELFRDGEVFMPEVLVSCDAYYAGLQKVQPLIEAAGRQSTKGKIILGTIHGDIHTVGKDVAVPVFRAAGFDVVDLGIDVPDEAFVEAIRFHRPQIVGLGTYMTSTFMHARQTVRSIEEAGLRGEVKIICGGPAVDSAMAKKMGADDASDNAWSAVEIMEGWTEGGRG